MTIHEGAGQLSCSVSHRRSNAMEVADSPLNLVSSAVLQPQANVSQCEDLAKASYT